MGNNFEFYGCDAAELAREYGTPLYVISNDAVRARCRELRESFTDRYENTRAVYACKAFLTQEICRIMKSEGMGMDAVSGGEIFAEVRAGMDPEMLVFHGNSKTKAELIQAVETGVGTIVVDNMSELELLNEIAVERGARPEILLRVTPGVDSHTHSYISTGQLDSKFGFSTEEVEQEAAKAAMDMEGVDLKGLHFHIGSQLHENDTHVMAVKIVLELLGKLREKYGFRARELNCGGGFGVHYAGDPETPAISMFMDPVMAEIDSFYEKLGDERPLVTIEPGRWLISDAGITIYEVGSVKVNGAGKTYVGVDGGMPDNPRTALYQAEYEVVVVEKPDAPKEVSATIAGKCCESGDIIAYDVDIPPVQRGDHLAVLSTGAYTYSMSGNYNRLPRPAVVAVEDGKAHLSVRRETYEDMISRDL